MKKLIIILLLLLIPLAFADTYDAAPYPALSSSFASTTGYGQKITITSAIQITAIEASATGTKPTKCYLWAASGTPNLTGTFSGTKCSLSAPYTASVGEVLYAQTDNNGASYSATYDGTTSYPQVDTYWTYNCSANGIHTISCDTSQYRNVQGLYWDSASTPAPNITQSTYNVTSAYLNETAWRTSTSSMVYTYDSTPSVTFNITSAGNCSIGDTNLNYTAMINDDASTKCGTTDTTQHTCTLPSSQQISLGVNSIYLSCYNGAEMATSTSGALNITLSDSTPPSVTIESPTAQAYTTTLILLDITATDAGAGIDQIWYYNGSDNVSYTVPVNLTLGIQEYTFCAYANDTAGNLNNTECVTFSTNKTTPSLSILTLPAATVTYGTTSNISGVCPAGLSCTLYKDGVSVADPYVTILAVGNYTFLLNTSGNEAYYSASTEVNVTVEAGGGSSTTGGGSSCSSVQVGYTYCDKPNSAEKPVFQYFPAQPVNLNIPCWADGKPCNYDFTCNATVIKPDSSIYLTANPTQNGNIFNLSFIAPSDYGKYNVVVWCTNTTASEYDYFEFSIGKNGVGDIGIFLVLFLFIAVLFAMNFMLSDEHFILKLVNVFFIVLYGFFAIISFIVPSVNAYVYRAYFAYIIVFVTYVLTAYVIWVLMKFQYLGNGKKKD